MKSNPLEETFDLEPIRDSDFEVIEYGEESEVEDLPDSYDSKDKSIDDEFDQIYVNAISAYNNLAAEVELVEGKYKARVGEVSNQFLNTALSAAKEKMSMKHHKDKLSVKENSGQSTTNNLFVGNHEELLKIMKDAQGIKNESTI